MISAIPEPSSEGLAARLVAKAQALAEARAASAAMARSGDPLHWRKPNLVWPLFTKG